ncbi:hypothetical protein COT65_02270 [Candidatus Shapirobacteria bacterium CG09_land_8_20_14_0_10_47_13]|uniref:Mannosyl-glycoprotein endo-beta-N-acetylglucosamidase-like domain-containing protein n=1 Tax=Candidatus Shapirobacteria bacterium CG09_land_8_20_14_0_10_47_13 TaxID=1974481 RepID=A0A2H0WMA9_9BACT|nr:MAG: hypothetical protein COT65_02270 [Candidatus Shapirobacteria bacterium CG09_land_8_20_14_0_10_47_13]
MSKLVLALLFLTVGPLTLGVSFFYLLNYRQIQPTSRQETAVQYTSTGQLFAALPKEAGEVTGEVLGADARPIIVEKYLQKYNSPFSAYADQLLAAAEKYNVDYRLIVAIAQCESNLCKKSPPGSFNCWGFENGETRFLSWEQAFDQVAKTLRERYLDVGLTTPEQIMPKYAPPSVAKGGPWAKCVSQFMEDLEYGAVD